MQRAEKAVQAVSRLVLRWTGCDYFPPPPKDWAALRKIVIGTKSHTIGDALMLSTLPERIAARWPLVRVEYLPRGFNAVVLANNPFVRGPAFFTREVYGDDANFGEGHLIQVKEQFFGVERSTVVRPRIYLSASEREWAAEFFEPREKPIVVLHPWGMTKSKVATREWWETLIAPYLSAFDFVQVGVEGQTQIKGCRKYLLVDRGDVWEARKLFACLDAADGFLGVDSGPMHVARAFEKPSLIILDSAVDPREVFAERERVALMLNRKRDQGFLYAENKHFCLNAPDAVTTLGVNVRTFLREIDKSLSL